MCVKPLHDTLSESRRNIRILCWEKIRKSFRWIVTARSLIKQKRISGEPPAESQNPVGNCNRKNHILIIPIPLKPRNWTWWNETKSFSRIVEFHPHTCWSKTNKIIIHSTAFPFFVIGCCQSRPQYPVQTLSGYVKLTVDYYVHLQLRESQVKRIRNNVISADAVRGWTCKKSDNTNDVTVFSSAIANCWQWLVKKKKNQRWKES